MFERLWTEYGQKKSPQNVGLSLSTDQKSDKKFSRSHFFLEVMFIEKNNLERANRGLWIDFPFYPPHEISDPTRNHTNSSRKFASVNLQPPIMKCLGFLTTFWAGEIWIRRPDKYTHPGRGLWVIFCKKCGECGECDEKKWFPTFHCISYKNSPGNSPHFLQKFTAYDFQSLLNLI